MGKKATGEQIAVVRSVVGVDFSEMDIIRALHLSNNEPAAAINILFDFHSKHPTSNLGVSTTTAVAAATTTTTSPRPSKPGSSVNLSSSLDWWLVGRSDLPGLSTCKGWRKIKPGDEVDFSFPPPPPPHPATHKRPIYPSTTKLHSKGRQSSSSEIVRFSTKQSGEIGRIPNEWARCLLPLVSAKKVRVDGCCKTAPDELRIMDTIVLSVSIDINIAMFRKCHLTSFKSTHNFNEESMDHPLPALFRLLGLAPFQKAALKPEDLYKNKKVVESKSIFGAHDAVQIAEYSRKLAYRNKLKIEQENVDNLFLDNIIGTTDNSNLEEMHPPDTLECELRPYQKQALYWMTHLEKGESLEEASTTLHPCWDAYDLADKRPLVIYVNAFSGDATTEFPSSLQMARGGILADAMGLGKTIMTISLLLACSGKEGSCNSSANQNPVEAKGRICTSSESPPTATEATSNSVFSKLMKPCNSLVGGGNLIVCPMTLLSQWKAEIEIHSRPGCLTLYMHYGQSRPKDAKLLTQYDVVLTTYGVVSSEFSAENSQDNGGLYCVKWFRVILDEAHLIKSPKSQISRACTALTAYRRWCLTGTPLQNNLEDIYSLLRFLRVEPWGSWSLWNKLVQKPFEEGNEHGIKLVQSMLRPIMLRRTKFSTDKEGRPILVLPPVNAKVIYCQLSDAEKDFYEALYRRSKVKFDQFIEQGRVLHNYASILELLLRLRQCCDHPFLVMSRGDTQDFSDLDKLANRLLKGGHDAPVSGTDVQPSRAFIHEVVEGLRKGDKGECPICLEAFEDAVLTPCAHCVCRECLLASWKSAIVGLCPICRKTINKHDLITAPTDSRFRIDIEKNWMESSKVSALLKELENLSTAGSKSIVFSQWTAFLDLLQIPLSRRNLTFVRLDGTLNQQQRERVIHKFTEEKDILVLLMSLKAGGVGINLTAASNAFLMDPWWNPAVEEQAVMRIHRIGQNNAVTIKRFIVKGTVEERMVAVQERKQKMISGALMDEEVRAARIEELKLLFS